MNSDIAALIDKIQGLEGELEAELAKRRAELRIGLEKGRAMFEEELLRRHRELRTRLSKYILNANPMVVLTAPVIYALIVPLVVARSVCHHLSGGVFSGLRHRESASQRLPGVRSPSSGLSERARKTQLRLLLLCQWSDCVCARDRGAHRAILVPDQARAARHRRASALQPVRGFRRRRGHTASGWREGAAKLSASSPSPIAGNSAPLVGAIPPCDGTRPEQCRSTGQIIALSIAWSGPITVPIKPVFRDVGLWPAGLCRNIINFSGNFSRETKSRSLFLSTFRTYIQCAGASRIWR